MSAGHRHELYVPGTSPLHRLAPEAKIAGATLFVIAVAVTPRRAVLAFAVHAAVVVIGVILARFRPSLVLRRLSIVIPFIAFAVFIPFVAGGPETEVLGLSLSTEGLWGSWNVVAKAVLGTSVSILLAGTTPIPDLLRGLAHLRVPTVLTSIIAFMFRYLDVIVGEMGRMRVAMVSRGHDARWLWQAKPIASSAGALFVRSYERGERVHSAMLARGYDGTIPTLEHHHASGREWAAALVPAAVAAVAAVAGAIS